jgi:hypothetical protein
MSRPEDEKVAFEITFRGFRRLSDLVVIEFEESADEEMVHEEKATTIEVPDGTQPYDSTQIYEEDKGDDP